MCEKTLPFDRLRATLIVGLLLCSLLLSLSSAADLKPSQKNILTLIDSGQADSAKTSIDKLLADFPQDPTLPGVIHKIANHYAFRGKISSAKELYSVLTTQFSQSPYADNARLDNIRLDIQATIDAGDYSSAADTVEQLISNNSKNDYLPQTLYLIAGKYKKCNMINQAKSLYQRISELSPDSEPSSKARIDVAKLDIYSLIVSGKYDAARSSADKLISDNSENKYLPSALFELADDCTKRHEYGEAKFLYERLISLFPADKRSSQAALEIAKLDIYSAIDAGNSDLAASLIEKLIQDNQAEPQLEKILYPIAGHFAYRKDFKQAKELYCKLKSLYPNSDKAYCSTLDIAAMDIFSSITSGDVNEANEFTVNLIADNAEHPYLPEVLYDIAGYHCKLRQYEQAENVYNYLIEHYPQNSNSTLAAIAVCDLDISSKINSGDFTAAREAIDKLISDYNNYPQLTQTLHSIAKKVFENVMDSNIEPETGNKMLNFAWGLMEKNVLGKITGKGNNVSAYYMGASYFYRLENAERTIEYADKLLQLDPNFKYAANMQWLIADGYERMKFAGQMPVPEANMIVEEAYVDLMEHYPTNSLADYAAIHLGEICLIQGRRTQACAYWGWFLMNADSNDCRIGYINEQCRRNNNE